MFMHDVKNRLCLFYCHYCLQESHRAFLIFMEESAICTTYLVSKMEEKSKVKQYISNGNNVLNFDIEIGEDSLEIILPERDAKFLLALFSSQLIVCLIQGVISILFCSELHKYFKETATVKSYRSLKPKKCSKEIYRNLQFDEKFNIIKKTTPEESKHNNNILSNLQL